MRLAIAGTPILAFLALGLLVSCGDSTRVAAATPTGNPDCSSNWRQNERDGFLALNLGPCAIFTADINTPQQHGLQFTYTLTRPLHVANIYGWVGTLFDTQIEVGNRLLIDIPPSAEHAEGLHREFEIQYDKHQDVVGNKSPAPTNVSLTLPAGTIMTVQRTTGLRTPPNCPPTGCAIEFRWVLQDNN